MGYAIVGQAAMIGMILSGMLITIKLLLGGLAFNPLVGFATVPLACLYLAIKGIKE